MLCFRNFPVAKKFMDERGGLGRKGVSMFSVEIFSHGLRKNFVGEYSVLCV